VTENLSSEQKQYRVCSIAYIVQKKISEKRCGFKLRENYSL